MLAHCQWVDVAEYIPSIRTSKRCHYWDKAEDMGCTFGYWHPLATEKLLALVLNIASDYNTYIKGHATIKGFSQAKCPVRKPIIV